MTDAWPLTDLRVLDATAGIAGAYCTKLLADAGATVVKAELPDGDPLRGDGPLFAYLHASKRATVVAEAGTGDAQLGRLLAWADVVVAGDGSEIASRLGDARAIRERQPEIGVVSVSWFGSDGPWADRPANEFILQALCGSIASRGRKHEPPVAAGGRVGEWAAGAAAAVAAVALWRSCRLGGSGGEVDISVLEAMTIAFNQYQAVAAQLDGAGPEPVRVPRVVDVPSIERTSDGWVGFATVRPGHFKAFAEMVGHAEWADDPELRRFDRRPEHDRELNPVIAAWTTARTTAEILDIAGRAHVPVAPIGNGETLAEIDYLRDRGVFVENPGGAFLQPRIPYRYRDIPQRRFEPAPTLDGEPLELPARAGRVSDPSSAEPSTGTAERSLPCRGIRVFDLTSTWAGPYAAQILGFLGADVIKVESVQRPDGTRLSTAFATVGDRPWELAPIFHGVNTTKRGITLDLSRPEGRELGKRVLATCDVLVENFTPRVLEKFGLLDDDVLAANPGLIVVRMPAWGLDGAWRDRPGFAQTMEQVTGLAWVTGFADGPPIVPRGPCDPIGGWHSALAVLAALESRASTGRGTVIEAPLVESALNVAAAQLIEHSATGRLVTRTGNRSGTAAPQNVYAVGDERWLAVSVETDEQWRALRTVLGDPEWAADPSLDVAAGRRAAHDGIDAQLTSMFAGQDPDELADRLWRGGVPAAPIVHARRAAELEQLQARRFFEPVQHEVAGTVATPRFPARWGDGTDRWHWRPAPTLGQDTRDVLADLGVGESELDRLEREQIIGTKPVDA